MQKPSRKTHLVTRLRLRAKAFLLVMKWATIVRFGSYKLVREALEIRSEGKGRRILNRKDYRHCIAMVRRFPSQYGRHTSCLALVCAAKELLHGEGIESKACIGARPSGQSVNPFEIHAWIEVEEKVLFGKLDGEDFTILWRSR